jgi:aldose 1-epimerase
VSIAVSIGNRAYEMKVRGKNILYFPFDNPAAAAQVRGLNGIPFLAPWANRMAGGSFTANQKRYVFNEGAGGLRIDANGLPIHGMLTASPLWEVIDTGSDAQSAHVTSRLEFWKYPHLMANWPFAHEYRMTYRLSRGVLEVHTGVRNLSAEAMPVAIGFHPYFILPDTRRDDAVAHMPVRKHIETDDRLVPTGELKPVTFPDRASLKEYRFDDGFTDLARGADGRAIFYIEGGGRRIEVAFGPKYRVAVIYAPPTQDYICFEPMTAITNGVNLAHEGKYADLQWIPAGGEWSESFWINCLNTSDR